MYCWTSVWKVCSSRAHVKLKLKVVTLLQQCNLMLFFTRTLMCSHSKSSIVDHPDCGSLVTVFSICAQKKKKWVRKVFLCLPTLCECPLGKREADFRTPCVGWTRCFFPAPSTSVSLSSYFLVLV